MDRLLGEPESPAALHRYVIRSQLTSAELEVIKNAIAWIGATCEVEEEEESHDDEQ